MSESRNKTGLHHLHEPWFRLATRCAVPIRKRFGVPDPKTEARIVRVFRAALRPRGPAGRRPNDTTVRAAEMWVAGMDKLTRQYRTTTLRRNVKAYLRRRGHKSAHGIRVSTAMRPPKR
jgi:hypothetical protein